MKRLISAALVLALSLPAFSQEVQLPAEIKAPVGVPVTITPIKVDGGTPKWKIGEGLTHFDLTSLFKFPAGTTQIGVAVIGTKNGTFKVWAWNAKGDVASDISSTNIIIGTGIPDGQPIPGPTPPPGPGPGPGPTPPTPNPQQAFINAPGLHVMFFENATKRVKLPRERLNIYWDPQLIQYLDTHCAKDPNGISGWVMADVNDDLSNKEKWWQDAAKRPRTDDNWMIVSNPGKGSWEGPLPANIQATLDIIKKYE